MQKKNICNDFLYNKKVLYESIFFSDKLVFFLSNNPFIENIRKN